MRNEAKLFIETAPQPVKRKLRMSKAVRVKRSQNIWNFLEAKNVITTTDLCKKMNRNLANFYKRQQRRANLSQSTILRVEGVLKEYGLKVRSKIV